MKFLCLDCDEAMKLVTTQGPDEGSLSVTFQQHGGAAIANAPLLFATNGQINVIVPGAMVSYIGAGTVDIVVNFGYGSGATLLKSTPFQVNIAATMSPGVLLDEAAFAK